MKNNNEKHADRNHLASLTEYERGRNVLANPPRSFNAMPIAALANTRSSLRVSRVTLPHGRSRSSPPKMECHQFHPYHVQGCAPNSSSSIEPSDVQIAGLKTVRPPEPPPPPDTVARTIDFAAATNPPLITPPSSCCSFQQLPDVQNMEIDPRVCTDTGT